MKLSNRLLTMVLSLGMVMPLCNTAFAADTIAIKSVTIQDYDDGTVASGLYEVNVEFELTGVSDQVTLLMTDCEDTAEITTGKENKIIFIDQMNTPDSNKCKFLIEESRIKGAGVDTTGDFMVYVHMGAEGVDTKATSSVMYSESTTPDEPSKILYGDVNGDGKIDSSDLLRLNKYFAKWNVEVDKSGADVNGDGKIDSSDLLRLKKYFAKWDVMLGG